MMNCARAGGALRVGLRGLAWIAIAGMLAACGSGSPATATAGDTSIVKVAQGTLQGSVSASGRAFLGIPYAAPPVGNLRWQAPQPPASWSGIRDATQFGPRCPQFATPLGNAAGSDEDCLYLNVYTPPVGSKLRPVMVWLHGGTFLIGSGNDYPGDVLAASGDVVVVTVNYRLGPFGFLALKGLATEDAHGSTGNYGLLDQRAALQWVHDNIARFGGDAANVTLFGESAGGISICGHLASPLSAGLFAKAIIESGPCSSAQTLSTAETFGKQFAARSGLDCTGLTAKSVVDCMRAKPTADILDAETPEEQQALSFAFGPVVDGYFLSQSPGAAIKSGQYNVVPILNGSNHDEGKLFVGLIYDLFVPPITLDSATFDSAVQDVVVRFQPQFAPLAPLVAPILERQYPLANYPAPAGYDPDIVPAHSAVAALMTDAAFACPALVSDDGFAAAAAPLYAYEFSDPDPPKPFTDDYVAPPLAGHAGELLYVFQAPLEDGVISPAQFTAGQLTLSTQMQAYWSNFAHHGDPNGAGLPAWPRYTGSQPQMLTLAPGDGGVTPQDAAVFKSFHKCRFWALLGG
jgi:para-nitrobenzyl esterase